MLIFLLFGLNSGFEVMMNGVVYSNSGGVGWGGFWYVGILVGFLCDGNRSWV